MRQKKYLPKPDLAPLVDLGFLLITFFMLTATLAGDAYLMNIATPKDGPPSKLKSALTIIPITDNQIYVCEDMDLYKSDLIETNYSSEGVRMNLLDFKHHHPKAPIVIKPSDHASLGNLVTVLDEIKICGNKSYVIDTLSQLDMDYLIEKGIKAELL